jgi:hypothetical protein
MRAASAAAVQLVQSDPTTSSKPDALPYLQHTQAAEAGGYASRTKTPGRIDRNF